MARRVNCILPRTAREIDFRGRGGGVQGLMYFVFAFKIRLVSAVVDCAGTRVAGSSRAWLPTEVITV